MAHCGYEPTAVLATTQSLRESLRAAVTVLSPMGFDLPSALKTRAGEGPALWARYLNPQTARVVRSIGFDRRWERGRGLLPLRRDGRPLPGLPVRVRRVRGGRGRTRSCAGALHDVLDAELADMVQMDTPLLAGLLAEALIDRAPDLDRVYMCNSGTEAVEAALKFARCATGRPRVLYCDHAFHGLTAGSLSVNGAKEFRDGFGPLLPGTQVPFGDLEALRRELARGRRGRPDHRAGPGQGRAGRARRLPRRGRPPCSIGTGPC